MAAVIRVAAVEMVKLNTFLVHTKAEVKLCHGELVLVCQEYTFGNASVFLFQINLHLEMVTGSIMTSC